MSATLPSYHFPLVSTHADPLTDLCLPVPTMDWSSPLNLLVAPPAVMTQPLTQQTPVAASSSASKLADTSHYKWYHKALRHAAVPGIFFGMPALGWNMMQAGVDPGAALAGVTLLSAGMAFGLEKVIPHRTDWGITREEIPLLGLHNLISTAAANTAAKHVFMRVGLVLGSLIFADAIPHLSWEDLPLADWSFPLQLGALVHLADFPPWLIHVLGHKTKLGWYWHRIHHRYEKLHFAVSGLNNWIDDLKQLSHVFVPMLLGAPLELIYLINMITVSQGIGLEHTNANLRTPEPMRPFINGPESHRFHHTLHEPFDKNFGNIVMTYDYLTSLPEKFMHFLQGKFPDLAKNASFVKLLETAKKWNMYLFVPDNVVIDVGIPESAELAPPGTPVMKQFLRDNFEPFVLSWRWLKDTASRAYTFVNKKVGK